MLRALHLRLGLAIGLLWVVLASTGMMLAVDAFRADAMRPAPPPAAMTVADLAAGLERHGTLAQVTVDAGRTIVVRFSEPRLRAVVDPTTLAITPLPAASELVRLATEIHRTLALGDGGRLISAIATALGLVSAGMGLVLALRRERSTTRASRLHRVAGLVLVVPFVFLATTGLGLAVAAFRPLAVHGASAPFPESTAEGTRLPVGRVSALRAVPVADLEDLVLPRRDDPDDTYRLTTVDASVQVDPVTGIAVAFRDRPPSHRWIVALTALHGGRFAAPLAVGLGLAAAMVPVAAVSGLALAFATRRARRRFRAGRDAETADTVVLVGSEGGTTRTFAERLVERLVGRGHAVHLAAMNDVAAAYPRAERLLILTATHGVGVAPGSADRFLERLPRLASLPPFAVVGFGERGATRFCGYAVDVDAAIAARGAPRLLPLHRVHRRSEDDFAVWVAAVLATLGDRNAADDAEAKSGTRARPAPSPPLVRRVLSGPAMGSRWSVTLHTPEGFDLAPLAVALAERIEGLEAAFSRFRTASELLRLDAAPLDRRLPLSDDMARILAVGLDVGRRSGGAFDLGLAAEVAANGFGAGWARRTEPHPDRRPAHEAIELDFDGRELIKRAPIHLDLAGIGKGYAADALARLVAEAGHPSHLVALDGELVAGAARPDGRPWSIGLEAPAVGARTTLGRIALVDRAVATSGDYRRFGATGGHTLDPSTGLPIVGGPASVTTLAGGCAEADAWATALMVAGRAGLAAARTAGIEAIFVDRPVAATAETTASPSPDGNATAREGRWREAHP